jgi:transposase-like protein
MGTARHQYTDEFKREAVGLLASSGRPLSQILHAHSAEEHASWGKQSARVLRPWTTSVRPPGSARTDQVLEDYGIRQLQMIMRFLSRRLQ